MGLLDMSRSEADLWMRLITEAAKLRGQPCLLYQIDKTHIDLQNDHIVKYKDPVLINILFEDQPKTVLKKMGWYHEEEELPYVAYLTNMDRDYADVIVEEDCRVSTQGIQVKEFGDSEFIITSVKGSSINPVFWICKLVPYRPKSKGPEVSDPEAPNNTDMGYSYIQRKR